MGDVLFSLLLAVIAIAGITRFLIIPYMQDKGFLSKTDTETSVETETTVSEEKEPENTEVVKEPQKEETEVSKEDPPKEEPAKEEEPQKEEEEKPADQNAQNPNVHPHNREAVEGATIDDCDVIFIGDSVFTFGDDRGFSIPQTFEEITEGAWGYGLGRGGMAAGMSTNGWISLPEAVEAFIAESIPDLNDLEDQIFKRGLQLYTLDDHTGRQLVIVLNVSINDYFMNTPIYGTENDGDTFTGALRNCFLRLSDEFPNAKIFICRTYTIAHGNYGYDMNTLQCSYNMYRNAIEEVAAEFDNVNVIKLDGEDGINYDNADQYLEDGTHPNKEGALRIANLILEAIKASL